MYNENDNVNTEIGIDEIMNGIEQNTREYGVII